MAESSQQDPRKPWGAETEGAAFKQFSREEAQAWRARNPQLSPWRVVAMQAAVGGVLSLLAWAFTQSVVVAWSVLYGAAVTVVPSALMARGMTSQLSGVSIGGGAVSFMLWEAVKIGVSVAMLMLAPRIVQPLSWPALMVGLMVCINIYWLAFIWRPRLKEH
jgi:ATP synthase protein I